MKKIRYISIQGKLNEQVIGLAKSLQAKCERLDITKTLAERPGVRVLFRRFEDYDKAFFWSGPSAQIYDFVFLVSEFDLYEGYWTEAYAGNDNYYLIGYSHARNKFNRIGAFKLQVPIDLQNGIPVRVSEFTKDFLSYAFFNGDLVIGAGGVGGYGSTGGYGGSTEQGYVDTPRDAMTYHPGIGEIGGALFLRIYEEMRVVYENNLRYLTGAIPIDPEVGWANDGYPPFIWPALQGWVAPLLGGEAVFSQAQRKLTNKKLQDYFGVFPVGQMTDHFPTVSAAPDGLYDLKLAHIFDSDGVTANHIAKIFNESGYDPPEKPISLATPFRGQHQLQQYSGDGLMVDFVCGEGFVAENFYGSEMNFPKLRLWRKLREDEVEVIDVENSVTHHAGQFRLLAGPLSWENLGQLNYGALERAYGSMLVPVWMYQDNRLLETYFNHAAMESKYRYYFLFCESNLYDVATRVLHIATLVKGATTFTTQIVLLQNRYTFPSIGPGIYFPNFFTFIYDRTGAYCGYVERIQAFETDAVNFLGIAMFKYNVVWGLEDGENELSYGINNCTEQVIFDELELLGLPRPVWADVETTVTSLMLFSHGSCHNFGGDLFLICSLASFGGGSNYPTGIYKIDPTTGGVSVTYSEYADGRYMAGPAEISSDGRYVYFFSAKTGEGAYFVIVDLAAAPAEAIRNYYAEDLKLPAGIISPVFDLKAIPRRIDNA